MEKNPLKAIVLLAPGFEEVEALTPVDYLRRADIEVCMAAVGSSGDGRTVTGSHDITVTADVILEELEAGNKLLPSLWDAVIVPGGMPGSVNLAASVLAGKFLREMAAGGKWVCAICAAPAVVLGPHGILAGRNFTCYPGMEEKVSNAFWKKDRVVIVKNPENGGIITSRGAGTAGEFSIAIISCVLNDTEAKKIAEKILLN